jgi:hypothetical protein
VRKVRYLWNYKSIGSKIDNTSRRMNDKLRVVQRDPGVVRISGFDDFVYTRRLLVGAVSSSCSNLTTAKLYINDFSAWADSEADFTRSNSRVAM